MESRATTGNPYFIHRLLPWKIYIRESSMTVPVVPKTL